MQGNDKHFWEFLNRRTSVHWKGYTNKERNKTIFELENIINRFGYIADYHMFSDMEISLTIGVSEIKIPDLHKALCDCLSLDGPGEFFQVYDTERFILLNVTFTQCTGDLRIEVPSVPG